MGTLAVELCSDFKLLLSVEKFFFGEQRFISVIVT